MPRSAVAQRDEERYEVVELARAKIEPAQDALAIGVQTFLTEFGVVPHHVAMVREPRAAGNGGLIHAIAEGFPGLPASESVLIPASALIVLTLDEGDSG